MALAGKLYGTFVVEGPLPNSSGTAYVVRHRVDARASAGVLKTVLLPRSDSLQPGVIAARRLDAIALQDKVASDWPEVAPILDRPTTREQLREALQEGQTWFVTHRYDISLHSLLAQPSPAPLDAAAIWMICRTVARGALAFQQVESGSGRRSHGNLKLSNILIRGVPLRQGASDIVVTDPAPGGRSDQTAEEREQLRREFERDDLEALGRILFQLVAGQVLPETTDWARVWEWPEGDPKRWRKIFGGKASTWRNLCRELLEVRHAPGALTLAQVDRRLAEMAPKEPAMKPAMLGVAALVLALVGGLLFGLWKRGPSAHLVVEASLPEVEVALTPADGGDKVKLPRSASATNAAAVFTYAPRPGRYLIEATPLGEFQHLPPVRTNVHLEAEARQVIPIHFDFARVILTSAPEGAEVHWRSEDREAVLGRTPLEVVLPPDDRYVESEFQFVAEGFTRKTVHAHLTAATNMTLSAALSQKQLGSVTAAFRSLADQGTFRKTRFFLEDEEKTSEIVELTPNQEYTLTILPPRPWREVETNISFPPEPLHHEFVYSPGYGTLVLTYQDVDVRNAAVWLRDETQELKLGTVGNEIFRLPEGRYTLSLELNGYLPTNFPVTINIGRTNALPVQMQRMTGP